MGKNGELSQHRQGRLLGMQRLPLQATHQTVNRIHKRLGRRHHHIGVGRMA